MALPTPVLSDGDIVEVQSGSYESARLIWNSWGQDPIKAAVLQSVLSCPVIVRYLAFEYRTVFSRALGQNRVCALNYSLLKGEGVHYLNVFRIPIKLMTSSLPCTDLLASGGQLLAISMFNRKTVPGYTN